jgi:hypothetical protein
MGNPFGASLTRYPLRPADLLASLADLTVFLIPRRQRAQNRCILAHPIPFCLDTPILS